MKIEEKVRFAKEFNTLLTTTTENEEILINLDNVVYFKNFGSKTETVVFFLDRTAPIIIRENFYNIQDLLHD